MSKMIRISPETYKTLDTISKKTGMSKKLFTEEAIERFAREKFLELAGQAYSRTQKNPQAWNKELEERALWETTLADGIDEEDY